MKARHHCKPGMTLVELLTVIAIIGLLAAIILPAIQAARESSRRSACTSQLRQIGIALSNYEVTYKTLPSGAHQGFYGPAWFINPVNPYDRTTWIQRILPFMDQAPLAEDLAEFIRTRQEFTSAAPFRLMQLPVLWCPSNPAVRIPHFQQGINISYVGCNGNGYVITVEDIDGSQQNGIFIGIVDNTYAAISDGLSNTVLASEILRGDDRKGRDSNDVRGRFWNSVSGSTVFSTMHPPNSLEGDNMFGYCGATRRAPCGASSWFNLIQSSRSMHGGGVNVVMADSSTRFINEEIDLVTWRAVGSRNENEVEFPE